MEESKVKFRKEQLSNMVLADWNYKEDDQQTKEKLKAGIKASGFLQNLVVRKIGDKYEVIDGNHRLVALQELGYKEIQVCDVGKITDEKAYLISLGLNEISFDNNEWRLNTIMKELAVKYTIAELEGVLPYSSNMIDGMINSATIDFEQMQNKALAEEDDNLQGFNTITLQVKDDLFNTWLDWCEKVSIRTGNKSKPAAFELAILNAIDDEKIFTTG